LAILVLPRQLSIGNFKIKKEQAMSIEKKSLISNRKATKKALVTKPEITKVATTRLAPRQHLATRVVARQRIVARLKLG
jgi:hypothetical protein